MISMLCIFCRSDGLTDVGSMTDVAFEIPSAPQSATRSGVTGEMRDESACEVGCGDGQRHYRATVQTFLLQNSLCFTKFRASSHKSD